MSGAAQIASAGISVYGGLKGMRLTSGSISAGAETPSVPAEKVSAVPPEETSAAPVEESTAPSAPPRSELGGGMEEPAPAQEKAGPTREENVREMTEQDSRTRQKAATENLDLAASQQLSARAHAITLVTQGLAQAASSTGEVIKSALDYESKLKEAKSKDDDATGRAGARLPGTHEGVRRFDAERRPGHAPGVPADLGRHAPDELAGLVASLARLPSNQRDMFEATRLLAIPRSP